MLCTVSPPSCHPPGSPCFARSTSAAPATILAQPAVALVGSRRPAPGAEEVAFEFGGVSAQNGFVVVSGLALGCDSAAHRGCLSAGGTTVAVLPCGVDHVAPVSNTALGEAILNGGGCFVSEYPPGTPPRNFRFVERNRIIAALSEAVIVIAAELKSGTLHTARFAREQNKALACYIPESGPASPGCLHLVERHNATPLRNPNELKLFLETFSCESRQPRESWRKGGGGGGRV
jgi:DNA processing protein